MFSSEDQQHMARALVLGERGAYTTTPNPRVGCVLVRNALVVGEGWHARAGEAHAEAAALQAAGGAARGATAYVTLEPCSHHGRTPPCAHALIAAGVARVVVAMADPNPLVAGTGMERLRSAGIAVECGLLEEQARELNLGFASRMQRGRPWVRLKIAASLDGKTALASGASRWITGQGARADGHHWRARACAILTGSGTVRADDPALTVREVETSRQPLRIVLDSRLSIPLRAQMLSGGGCLVVAARDEPSQRSRLEALGNEVLLLPDADGQIDLAALLNTLAAREMNEVHVEAGPLLNGALLRQDLADELLLYLAPSIMGEGARGMFAVPVLTSMAARYRLEWREVRQLGEDLRLLGRFRCAM